MLPRLAELAPATRLTRDYLAALRVAGFRGDLATEQAARLAVATDNSVYQLLPQAVVHPRDHADVVTLFRVASEPRFAPLSLTPRGGGTGTNGQALTTGVVVDVSRHMRRILAIDPVSRTATVEPGVVLDQLQDALAPHGLFFAPNLSPSSRATLGGMIATDASGEGSRVYGKTSQHLLGLRAVLIDGEVLETGPLDRAALAAAAARPGRIGQLHRDVARVLDAQRDRIARDWPRLTRYVTGYNLAMARGADPEGLDLTHLLAGAEGTLGLVTEARLRLTPIPRARRLVVLTYGRFEDALASAEARVAQAAATLKEARANLARMEEVSRLSGGRVPSATEFDGARANADRALADENAARAAVADAKAALSSDATNLAKASIRSPIDGVVLTRSVDPGNAVAASLQAVTLFTVAADLRRMKLQVNIDEADVGQVRAGQKASFTVAAWPSLTSQRLTSTVST